MIPPSRVRPRVGRIVALLASVLTVAVSVMGGTGLIPLGGQRAQGLAGSPARAGYTADTPPPGATRRSSLGQVALDAAAAARPRHPLPAHSGHGRRVVFSTQEQHVWLVGARGQVARSYPVSGSRYDNLDPGRYSVYSRSLDAVGIDGSTMRYFVRFAQGDNAAIGFHSIPVSNGEPEQTRTQLGTPLSHGCIRQWLTDAKSLWRFAPVGTRVVVLA